MTNNIDPFSRIRKEIIFRSKAAIRILKSISYDYDQIRELMYRFCENPDTVHELIHRHHEIIWQEATVHAITALVSYESAWEMIEQLGRAELVSVEEMTEITLHISTAAFQLCLSGLVPSQPLVEKSIKTREYLKKGGNITKRKKQQKAKEDHENIRVLVNEIRREREALGRETPKSSEILTIMKKKQPDLKKSTFYNAIKPINTPPTKQ